MTHALPLSILLLVALFSPAVAEDAQERFEADAAAAFGQAIADHDISGLVVGVTKGGEHRFYATGLASREDVRPVTPDTIFELGSISKIFNVTLAALAEDRGELSLDAHVSTWLPRLQGVPAGQLSLLDLATHHSGGLPLQVPDDAKSVDQLVDWLQAWTPPKPGARSYSNISIGLLGHVTAGAMGMSYADALGGVLFPALGLKDSWVEVPPAAADRYAYGYDRKTDAPIRVTPGVLDHEAYGVKSTARDMLTLLDVELGEAPVGPDVAKAVSRTQEPQFQTRLFTQGMIWEAYPWPADPERLVAGNGYDFILKPQPMEVSDQPAGGEVLLNKTGSTNGFGAYVALVPSEDLGVVVLANRNFPNEARVRAVLELISRLTVD